MKQSKLIQLLKTLSPKEFRKLKKLFQSPFFTTNPVHLELYILLKKYNPSFNHPRFTKEYIFSKIFPKVKYDDNKMRTLMKDFTRLIEDFLLWTDLKNKRQERQKRLLTIYAERDLFQWYERGRNQLLEELAEKNYRDLEYFNELYMLDFDYFFHPLTKKNPLQDEVLIRLMNSVDQQFALAKYRIRSEMKNRERILNKKYSIRFLDAIKDEVNNGFLKDNTFFQLFTLLFELYEKENAIATFEQLKKLFKQELHHLRKIDQSLFLTQFLNYTIRQINSGHTRFYKEALSLYQTGLEQQLIIQRQQITETTFGNIATLGCHAGEFEWTKQFINDYQVYLDEAIRADVVAMNLGLWHFYQDDFNAAYQLFLTHAFTASYQPKARFNLIRTAFEQFLLDEDMFDFVIAQIEAFEKLLYRKELSAAYHKEAYLNSIQLLKRLVSYISKRKSLDKLKQSFLQQIKQKESMMARDWFLKKLDMLM